MFQKKSIAVYLAGAFAIIGLSGCANLTHYNNQRSGLSGDQKLNFIDAKQRVILATRSTTGTGEDALSEIRTCAEPSPDALSAIAASQGVSLSRGDLDLALNNSIAESAGSIGLRTQSIQLMRDAMYRLCEGYASGALSRLSFETMHRRFQSSMVTILAIEQLTGVTRQPAILLDSSTGSGPDTETAARFADQVDARQTELNMATQARDTQRDGAVRTAEDNLSTERAKLRGAAGVPVADEDTKLKPQIDALAEANQRLAELEQQVLVRQTNLTNARSNLSRALSPSTSASTTARGENIAINDCCDSGSQIQIGLPLRGGPAMS